MFTVNLQKQFYSSTLLISTKRPGKIVTLWTFTEKSGNISLIKYYMGSIHQSDHTNFVVPTPLKYE